jgi:tight adherence protein C
MWLHILLLALIFVAAVTVGYLALNHWLPTALDKRMSVLFDPPTALGGDDLTAPLKGRINRWLAPFATAGMKPEAWLTSPLKIRFSNAGLNQPHVLPLYIAGQVFLVMVIPAVAWFLVQGFMPALEWGPLLLILLLSAGLGYATPHMVLSHRVRSRQTELFRAFPDAIDLLRVCVEAGLGLDAAIERVGREIQLQSEALSEELSLLGLELRAGSLRTDALRNLALRIGLEDIDALVSMLIQADRFGTSIAESLKVHSASLRTKRRLAAEIAAARLPVKILMPLVFCIFPALLTVLLGPAVINITQILMPKLASPTF